MENLDNWVIVLWVLGMTLPLFLRAILIGRVLRLVKNSSVSNKTINIYVFTGESFLVVASAFACLGFYYILTIPLGIVQIIFLFSLMVVPLDMMLVLRKVNKQRPPSSY